MGLIREKHRAHGDKALAKRQAELLPGIGNDSDWYIEFADGVYFQLYPTLLPGRTDLLAYRGQYTRYLGANEQVKLMRATNGPDRRPLQMVGFVEMRRLIEAGGTVNTDHKSGYGVWTYPLLPAAPVGYEYREFLFELQAVNPSNGVAAGTAGLHSSGRRLSTSVAGLYAIDATAQLSYAP